LQIIECFMNGVVHERGRISQRVAPQVDVDDQGARCFQGRDQVISQKRRFTCTAQAGQKQTRAKAFIQYTWIEKLIGH